MIAHVSTMNIGIAWCITLGILVIWALPYVVDWLRRYAASKASRGWLWVIVGHGGIHDIRWRYGHWKRGRKRCSKCEARVNTATQVGVEWAASEQWCPLCTERRWESGRTASPYGVEVKP